MSPATQQDNGHGNRAGLVVHNQLPQTQHDDSQDLKQIKSVLYRHAVADHPRRDGTRLFYPHSDQRRLLGASITIVARGPSRTTEISCQGRAARRYLVYEAIDSLSYTFVPIAQAAHIILHISSARSSFAPRALGQRRECRLTTRPASA